METTALDEQLIILEKLLENTLEPPRFELLSVISLIVKNYFPS